MTVIAWDGKTLAADKLAGDAYVKYGRTTKIHKLRDHLVGFAGDASAGRELLAWFAAGAEISGFPEVCKDRDSRGTMLVITPTGVILTYQETPYPIEWDSTQHAIGSGREAALAAMHLGHDARTAVDVASAVCVGCGNGIDTLELP